MTEGELRDLTFSHRAAVMAGVANGTFEPLADTPRTAQEIAAACGMAERGACALLEALAALGLVERCGAAFVATPEAKRVLTEKGERSRRHTVLHDLWHTGLWTRLEESLASGLSLTDRSDDPFFTRPDVLVRFFPNLARAMAETSRDDAHELARSRRTRTRRQTLSVPEFLAPAGDAYVLRVRGDSMIEAHITDGDWVLIRPQSTAANGDIVVAQVEENAVTLKRFFKEKNRVRLQPANPSYPAQFYDDVRIQGKLIGVIRRVD